MANDLPLFAMLADSVDRHAQDGIRHHVVVPAADLPEFRRFAGPNRDIIAQEDLLPVRLWKLPGALRHLAPISEGFRRPIYLTSDRHLVRGWMLQQLLKLNFARASGDAAVMHVDSDVCFFRDITHGDAFAGDRTRFFRVTGNTRNPKHRAWTDTAARFLGIDPPSGPGAHFVENCVLWDSGVVRALIDRIEAVAGHPLSQVVFGADTMSEYYVYGLFADHLAPDGALHPQSVSFCLSHWPDETDGPVDLDTLRARLDPGHRAIAIQSTNPIPLARRGDIYQTARREFGQQG